MDRRKIQLIAGTTYSVSLPKSWVLKNNLKERSEVLFYEKDDRKLILTPGSFADKKTNTIDLNIDEYQSNIDQILFAVYYLGIETINLFSKKGITKEVESKIRRSLTYMSGTEISYEDKNKIAIKVLLDKSKVDMIQVIYRIGLIIESSISTLVEKMNINEIRINENEVDRLYHLISKIISISLTDSSILHSSGIKNVSLAPSYFLIGKKLENIADNVHYISEYLNKKNVDIEYKKEIFDFVGNEIGRCINAIKSKQNKIFEKVDAKKIKQIDSLILKIKDDIVQNYIEDVVRYVLDIEEEIVNISFYNQLINQNIM